MEVMVEPEVKAAYIRLHGEWAWSEEHCIESFVSKFDYREEMETYIMDQWYETAPDIPYSVWGYIDEKAVLRDLWIETYIAEDDDASELGYFLFYRI
jgi:hypothetical protein